MWWHTVSHVGKVKGKLANAVGSQYLFTLPRNMVYPALLPLMPHTSAASSRLNRPPPLPSDLNGLVPFRTKRLNLVSAHVPSYFKRCLLPCIYSSWYISCVNVAWLLAGSVWFLPTNSQNERMTYTNCCIYRAVPPWWWAVTLRETCRG